MKWPNNKTLEKKKKTKAINESNYPQSQHESPALNCPLKRSTELTPLPLHCEHRTAPVHWPKELKSIQPTYSFNFSPSHLEKKRNFATDTCFS
jgi:hypothetical protein